jgi:hypothetical protein
MVSVCFLRTQQRAKSQCIIYVRNPRRAGFSRFNGFSHVSLVVGFLVSGWFFRGLAGAGHSTESLILAQDERWRRA